MPTSPDNLAAATPKPPASDRKRAAASANGAKGRGRTSEAGKRASAQNALKHGLTASTIVLATEDAGHYEELRATYIDFWKPQNILEADLVDEMLAAKWRQRRAWALESATIDLELDRQRPQIERDFTDISADIRTALAFEAKAAPGGSLPSLLRLEARLSRQYSRALRTLLELRAAQPPAPPAHQYDDPCDGHAGQPAADAPDPAASPEPVKSKPGSAHTTFGQNEANPISEQPPQRCFTRRIPLAIAVGRGSSDAL